MCSTATTITLGKSHIYALVKNIYFSARKSTRAAVLENKLLFTHACTILLYTQNVRGVLLDRKGYMYAPHGKYAKTIQSENVETSRSVLLSGERTFRRIGILFLAHQRTRPCRLAYVSRESCQVRAPYFPGPNKYRTCRNDRRYSRQRRRRAFFLFVRRLQHG